MAFQSTAPIFSDPTYFKQTSATKTDDKKDATTIAKDDFMKLLFTQLKNQDPLNPVEDKDFIAQLASFSSLEQTTLMNNNISSLLKQEKISNASAASSLIGQAITSLDNDSGIVRSIAIDEKGVYVSVNGKNVALDRIKEIRNPYIT
ncbi:MAG: hypothetical protein HQL10_04015 [Nitrospirae bacterium]|nr:hypothetical protein [Nitrospirota bacterium]